MLLMQSTPKFPCLPEGGRGEGIDEKVHAGIQSHETMWDGGSSQCPETDAVAILFDAKLETVQGEKLVEVEHESGSVAEEEQDHWKEFDTLKPEVKVFWKQCMLLDDDEDVN